MFMLNQEHRQAAAQRTSIFRKALGQMLLLSASVIVLLSCVAFAIARGVLLQRVLSQVAAYAAVAEDTLAQSLNDARLQASLLAGHADLRSALAGRGGIGGLFASLSAERPALRGMAVFSGSGVTMARAGADIPFPGAVRGGATVVSGTRGWEAYDVSAPAGGGSLVVLRFDAAPLTERLTAPVGSLGATADLFLAVDRGGKLSLLHPSGLQGGPYTLFIGDTQEQYGFDLPAARAVRDEEGARQAEDHRGHAVLTAFRSLPSLGGGLIVQVDSADALGGVSRLMRSLLATGVLLLAFAVLLALLLARSLVGPLRSLSAKVGKLGPGAWGYARDIKTGDETEVLDDVVADMAARLERIYGDLEGEIRQRTRELEAQFVFDRTVLNSIRHGIVAVDAAGVITALNPAAETLLGLAHDRLLGHPARGLLRVTAEGKEGEIAVLDRCLEAGESFRPEPGQRLVIAAQRGAALPVMLLASPLFTPRSSRGSEAGLEDGKPFGAVMVFQDVRDERRMDEMKSEFITLASHQLRTPLSILRWHADLLRGNEGLDAEQKDSVTEIDAAAGRMTDLLNALLQVVQLESASVKPFLRCVDGRGIVSGAVTDLKDVFARRKIACRVVQPESETTVCTDPALLGIVIHNLLTNAVKYSKDGSSVDVTLAAAPDSLTVTVTDQGLGIPERQQDKLFQKFFRADNVRTVDTDGNGLGLYILKMIVDGLGGEIGFRSTEGKGSAFTVTIPRKLEERAALEQAEKKG